MAKLDLIKLREIGWSLWDPIGLKSKLDEGYDIADEYDTYLVQVASRLRLGASDDEALAFLIHSETVSMGLNPRGSEPAIATVQAIKAYVNTLAQG